jgi:hypothetical protein
MSLWARGERSSTSHRILGLVVALTLAGSVVGFGGVWVPAEGVAALDAGPVDVVRDEALRDAWRRAVEQGAGLFLHAEATVENLILVSSSVSARVDAYISDFEILREWEDGLFFRMEILAEVNAYELGRTIEELGFEIETLGDPRTAIRIDEYRGGEQKPLSVAEALVREALERKGFLVVDPSEATGVSFSTTLDDGPKAALELAQIFDADVAIVGTIATEPIGTAQIGLFTWYSARALADLVAVLRSTGEVIASVYAEARAPRTSMETAEIDAIKEVTAQALPELVFDMVASLSLVEGAGLRAIRLVVEGLESLSEAEDVLAALGALRETLSVTLRQYGESLTAYDVVYLGTAAAFGGEIESDEFASTLEFYSGSEMRLEIRGLDFASIHAEVRH